MIHIDIPQYRSKLNWIELPRLTSRLCCHVRRVDGLRVSGPNVRYRAKASAGPIAMASSSSNPSAFNATTAPLLSNLTSAICKCISIKIPHYQVCFRCIKTPSFSLFKQAAINLCWILGACAIDNYGEYSRGGTV